MIAIKKAYNWLLSLWTKPIIDAQRNYRKSQVLNKYSPQDWRDDIFWRN